VLHVDFLTAYVLCGASALVAAGLLLLAKVDEPALARALRSHLQAFLVIAAGLFPLGWAVDAGAERHPLVLLAVEATLLATALFGRGFAQLRGARPLRHSTPLVAVLMAVDAAAWTGPALRFEQVFTLSVLAIASVITVRQCRAAGVGRTLAERAVTASLVLFALAFAVRLAFALLADGSRSFLLVHLPPALLPWFGLFYAIVPLIIAALTLNLVNERLGERLRAQASTDELTGTFSRRAMRERAPALLENCAGLGRSVATLMVDIDHFKHVNDRHGHLVGDTVLRRAADLLRANLRGDSVLTRYGGEEFVVLLPVAGLDEARAVAERLRKAFETDRCEFEGAQIAITISAGLALLTPGEPLEAALSRADAALYRAKNGGRNRVAVTPLQDVA
jgi:diguanylate cyclase (GGDEF)-like protein